MPRTYGFLKVQLQFKMAADRVPSLKLSGVGFVKMLLRILKEQRHGNG